jgi:ElaB/YqjD/DUF883 family membrane-anchored ribosome-binding protein
MSKNIENRLNFNSNEYEKNILEREIINKAKDSLSEFDYLKLAWYEFDKLKFKINELNIPEEQKNLIIELVGDKIMYELDNDKDKLNILKKINDIVDKVKNWKDNINQIKKEIEEKFADHPILKVMIFAVVAVILGLLVTSSAEGLAMFFGFSLLTSVATHEYSEHKREKLEEKNILFDTINDIYPDITKEEFDKLYKVYEEWKLDFNKLNEFLDNYYKDWKITEQEHKELLNYLNSFSK